MTILGHQQGPSYMLLPLRPHCAASDLMSQQRLWRFLLLFHNSQLSVSCGPKHPNVALNRELVALLGSSWGIGLIKAFLSIFWGFSGHFKVQEASYGLNFKFPWGNRWVVPSLQWNPVRVSIHPLLSDTTHRLCLLKQRRKAQQLSADSGAISGLLWDLKLIC